MNQVIRWLTYKKKITININLSIKTWTILPLKSQKTCFEIIETKMSVNFKD